MSGRESRTSRRTPPRAPSGDAGLAAVELALLLTVLLALVALVAPLTYLFYERVQLGRATGDTIRFATSRSDEPRVVAGLTIEPGRLPTRDQAGAEAARSGTGRRPVTMTSHSRSRDPSCPSFNRLEITLTTTVDVGPFAGLLLSGSTTTLTAKATSCEE